MSNSAVSALETSANIVVETSAAGEGMKQPGSRSCWSRREMAVLKSQLQIKAGRTLGTQLVLGLGVRDSCQKAKLASRAEAAGNQYRSYCVCPLVRPALQKQTAKLCLFPSPSSTSPTVKGCARRQAWYSP